ncbi:MAG: hypothetical protein MZU95_07445 [Desulfomicrobium escambiense]|nr:hypothetical protein [Desulfomicrobium escambiense]
MALLGRHAASLRKLAAGARRRGAAAARPQGLSGLIPARRDRPVRPEGAQ